MRVVKLDGQKMTDKHAAHRYIQDQLAIPGYFGKTLDALYDALSVYDKDLSIMLLNKPEAVNQLGSYGEKLIQTFRDVQKVNTTVEFKVI